MLTPVPLPPRFFAIQRSLSIQFGLESGYVQFRQNHCQAPAFHCSAWVLDSSVRCCRQRHHRTRGPSASVQSTDFSPDTLDRCKHIRWILVALVSAYIGTIASSNKQSPWGMLQDTQTRHPAFHWQDMVGKTSNSTTDAPAKAMLTLFDCCELPLVREPEHISVLSILRN